MTSNAKRVRARARQERAEGIERQRRLEDLRARGVPSVIAVEELRILHAVIDPAYLAEEPALQETRWLEYGYTNAFQATEAFTRCYVEAYAKLRRKFFSMDPHRCPIEVDFARNTPGLMNALFRARQFADAMGVPYMEWIQALGAALINDGSYQRVPMPNQLYPATKDKALRHGVRLVEQLVHADKLRHFQANWDARLRGPGNPQDPIRQRALRTMRDLSAQSVQGPALLRSWLQKGFITPDEAQALFPEAAYARVIAAVCESGEVPTAPTTGPQQFRPHCFGMHQAEVAECGNCPVAKMCATMVDRVVGEQIAVTGSAAPRAERQRALARDRQRAKRKRDAVTRAEAKASSLPASGSPGEPERVRSRQPNEGHP